MPTYESYLEGDQTAAERGTRALMELGVNPEFVAELPIEEARMVIDAVGQALNRSFHPDRYKGSFSGLSEHNLRVDTLRRMDDDTLKEAIRGAIQNDTLHVLRTDLKQADAARQIAYSHAASMGLNVTEALAEFESKAWASMTGMLMYSAHQDLVHSPLSLSQLDKLQYPVGFVSLEAGLVKEHVIVNDQKKLYKQLEPAQAEALQLVRGAGDETLRIFVTPRGDILRFNKATRTYIRTEHQTEPGLLAEGTYWLYDATGKKDPTRLEPAIHAQIIEEGLVILRPAELVGSHALALWVDDPRKPRMTVPAITGHDLGAFQRVTPLDQDELASLMGSEDISFVRPQISEFEDSKLLKLAFTDPSRAERARFKTLNNLTIVVDYDTI